MSESPPVFIWPFPRSGGTLLTTVLGTHSRLALSYEMYEEDLRDDSGRPQSTDAVLGILSEAGAASDVATRDCVRRIAPRRLRSFVARAHRSGLEAAEVHDELEAHAAQGGSLLSLDGRLDYVDRLMRAARRKFGKERWGGKAKAPLGDLHRRHPRAHFLFVLRDGRDVLASQLALGSFGGTSDCSRDWATAVRSFREFSGKPGARTLAVRYEELVTEPARAVRACCTFLGVPFESEMLSFEKRDLVLLRNPYAHPSAGQIARGINQSSVGRWRRDLSAADLELFRLIAGEELTLSGYA